MSAYNGMRATLREIRESDGAQRYEVHGFEHLVNAEVFATLWLMGVNRNPEALVGDTGTLVYEASLGRGWYRFGRDRFSAHKLAHGELPWVVYERMEAQPGAGRGIARFAEQHEAEAYRDARSVGTL